MKQVLKSLHGRIFGIADDDSTVCAKGIRAGDFPRQFLQPSPLHVVTLDDFDGAAILGTWGVTKGSDGGCANFAINAALSGTIRATTGAGAGASMAVNGVQVSGHLNFQANAGGCEFGYRVKLGAITTAAIFVGWTNQVAALQMPLNGAGGGNGFTVNANDCVGMLFDTTMTNATWWAASAKGGVATAGINSGVAPIAAAYDDVFVQVDANGNASFYLDGVSVGSIQGAVTANVPLAPVIAAFRRSAASTTLDADYIYSAMNRV
jgi:hypothetical protein